MFIFMLVLVGQVSSGAATAKGTERESMITYFLFPTFHCGHDAISNSSILLQ